MWRQVTEFRFCLGGGGYNNVRLYYWETRVPLVHGIDWQRSASWCTVYTQDLDKLRWLWCLFFFFLLQGLSPLSLPLSEALRWGSLLRLSHVALLSEGFALCGSSAQPAMLRLRCEMQLKGTRSQRQSYGTVILGETSPAAISLN